MPWNPGALDKMLYDEGSVKFAETSQPTMNLRFNRAGALQQQYLIMAGALSRFEWRDVERQT